jgi:hypothetical protein
MNAVLIMARSSCVDFTNDLGSEPIVAPAVSPYNSNPAYHRHSAED